MANANSQLSKRTLDGTELTADEYRFLLAYAGVQPKSPAPRLPWEAYRCIRPGVTETRAHAGGRQMLQRIKAKGLLHIILEINGLGLNAVIEALREGLRAERVRKVIHQPGGVWDYDYAPDYRTRHRVTRTLLELHDCLQPAGSGGQDDGRMTFADAVRMQAEEAERKRMIESGEITDAEFTEEDN